MHGQDKWAEVKEGAISCHIHDVHDNQYAYLSLSNREIITAFQNLGIEFTIHLGYMLLQMCRFQSLPKVSVTCSAVWVLVSNSISLFSL